MGRYQKGYIYAAFGAFHVRYYATAIVDGKPKRVHKSHRLCAKDDKYHSRSCKPLRQKCDDFMRTINAGKANEQDMRVVDFWETQYLPYCETGWKGTGMKSSTVRGFKQVWRQHLKSHFADLTIQNYAPDVSRRFLSSLKTKQGKKTLKHIRALASAMFSEATERNLRPVIRGM
jgi:hypothetical protein